MTGGNAMKLKNAAGLPALLLILILIVMCTAFPVWADDGKGPGYEAAALFQGQEILLVNSQTEGQMMSYVITSVNGHIVVIDGGTADDAPHLREILMQKGGVVDAWFITHAHSDHVGALNRILSEGTGDLTIRNVYYNFAPAEWYLENEPSRADTAIEAKTRIEALGPAAHTVTKGEVVTVDDISVTVLNEPYLFPVNSINNSSVAYRMDMGGRRVIFLGDMGSAPGQALLRDVPAEELKADIVQMAHHGQYGVDREVYEVIRPFVCMWNTPEWLYTNRNGTGEYLTLVTRQWMRELGVNTHITMFGGDRIIK